MRTTLALNIIFLLVAFCGCNPSEPVGPSTEPPVTDTVIRADLPTIALDELPAEYVQVPGLTIAIEGGDQWGNELTVSSHGGHTWPRHNDQGVVVGSIHFEVMPRFIATPQAQSEAAAAGLKESAIYVKDGNHQQALEVDKRAAYLISNYADINQKSLYMMQVTIDYNEDQYLLATCSYETNLTDDISDELLEKIQTIRFLNES